MSDFSLSSSKELQLENYEELQQKQREISEENKQLLEELSQLTAELEIKELKIKSLQKKIAEMSAVFQSESEFDSENQEIKLKIQLQQDKILALQAHLKKSEVALEELSTKPCCILF